jgi:RHS repeat-associated protein
MDSTGDVFVTYQYTAFGILITSPPAWDTNPFRFNGEYRDWERDEYYLRARSYNPNTGRFTQADPFWNNENMIYGSNPVTRNDRLVPNPYAVMQSGNLYAYCMNNPLYFIDPSGQLAIETAAAIIVVASMATVGFLTYYWSSGTANQLSGLGNSYDNTPTSSSTSRTTTTTTTTSNNTVIADVPSVVTTTFPINSTAPLQTSITLGNMGLSMRLGQIRSWDTALNRARASEPMYIAAIVNEDLDMAIPDLSRPLPMTATEAYAHILTISTINDKKIRGVMTITRQDASYLVNLFGGAERDHGAHGSGRVGYFPHFHPRGPERTHIWYLR